MSNFPDSPKGWAPSNAEEVAASQQLTLTPDHWNIVEALQGYFKTHDKTEINRRELTDALDEKFHSKGGMKYLYKLLPSGPISQGCALAGISNPSGNVDVSFGSVV
ncbi:MAG: TusE/DsrC/DsvC family sulfur relay protein [Cocleimonas sp.]|nr:TusE/DsrC/DsvC family sulfur relay protein [Cocleimonas sp.]